LMRGKYLQRQPEDVVDEIEKIPEDHIYFVDDETFLNQRPADKDREPPAGEGSKSSISAGHAADTIVIISRLFRL